MTTTATTLTYSGLRDWIIQRITAAIIGLYTIFIVIYLLSHPGISYAAWHQSMANTFMQIFSVLTLLSIVSHAWVGIWTVFTDYVKCYCLRLLLEVLMGLFLFSLLLWGIEIIWFGK